MLAIETRNLHKSFGSVEAVKALELNVPVGTVFGFLGPNGAGKTTFMRLLLGLLRPDEGEVQLFGQSLSASRKAALAKVGALIERPCIYPHLTGEQNLSVTSDLLGAPRSEIDRVLQTVGLEHARKRRAGGYSLGMRQRLGLARALLGKPRLLILDEPMNGLDPDSIIAMRELIRTLPETDDCTVFISSHALSEVEKVVDHAAILESGRLALSAPMTELRHQSQRIHIRVNKPDQACALLNVADAVIDRVEGNDLILLAPLTDREEKIAHWNKALVQSDIHVSRLEVHASTLEALYNRVVQNQASKGGLI